MEAVSYNFPSYSSPLPPYATGRLLIHGNAGESHSALILLYRAIDLPTAEEVKETEDVTMQES